MTFWEFLDRRHARKFARAYRPWDGKLLLGGLFFLGYYGLVYRFTMRDIPQPNLNLLQDSLLVLGPPVGAIVSAIWRTDRRDEMQAENTAEGFKAMRAQAVATTAAAAAGTGGGGNDGEPTSVVIDQPADKPVPTKPVKIPEPEFVQFEPDPPEPPPAHRG